MLNQLLEKIKRSLLGLFIVFVIGNSIGGLGAYYTIAQDCSVMGVFRIGVTAYSCQRLRP
jgi:hypothetical protein